MSKIQGIGGVFIYARDAEALASWYENRLGLSLNKWGESYGLEFPSADIAPGERRATTTFAIFQLPDDAKKGAKTARLNFRVTDLDAMLDRLKDEGVFIEEAQENSEYGRFAWVHDLEENRVELWQPPLTSEGWPE